MLAPIRFVVALGFLAICLAPLAAQEMPPPTAHPLKVWTLQGPGSVVTTGQPYTLRNLDKGASLRYGHQDHGINLVWDQSPDLHNIQFKIPSSFQAPAGATVRDHRKVELHYGQYIAIELQGGGYWGTVSKFYTRGMVFKSWSTTPKYSYVIEGGPKGTPVQVGKPFALKAAGGYDLYLLYVGSNGTGAGLDWRSKLQ